MLAAVVGNPTPQISVMYSNKGLFFTQIESKVDKAALQHDFLSSSSQAASILHFCSPSPPGAKMGETVT